MQRYQVRIEPRTGEPRNVFELDSPNLRTALVVAEINLGGGTAEIWHRDRRLARMRNERASGQVFWELR